MWCQAVGTGWILSSPTLTYRVHKSNQWLSILLPSKLLVWGMPGSVPMAMEHRSHLQPAMVPGGPGSIWQSLPLWLAAGACLHAPMGRGGARDSCWGCSNACLQGNIRHSGWQCRSQGDRAAETMVTNLCLPPCHFSHYPG